MKSERQGPFILGSLGSRTLLDKLEESMNAHRLNRIALVTVFGLALALPQAARGQTLVTAAEDIAGDSEVLRLADDTEVLRLAGDTEAYNALRRISDGLYARGEASRAIQLREELGDLALSNRDAGVAADAYLDAAWIAQQLALQMNSRTKPPYAWSLEGQVKWLKADAERLLRKAEAVAESGDLTDLQLAPRAEKVERAVAWAERYEADTVRSGLERVPRTANRPRAPLVRRHERQTEEHERPHAYPVSAKEVHSSVEVRDLHPLV
jgi:hypothetical protein